MAPVFHCRTFEVDCLKKEESWLKVLTLPLTSESLVVSQVGWNAKVVVRPPQAPARPVPSWAASNATTGDRPGEELLIKIYLSTSLSQLRGLLVHFMSRLGARVSRSDEPTATP